MVARPTFFVTLLMAVARAPADTSLQSVRETWWIVKEAGKFLEYLTEETGGRVLFANASSDLRATFTKTLGEFRERYVLSYMPTGASPPPGGIDSR